MTCIEKLEFISKMITEGLKKLNMTQSDLARKMNVNQQSVNQWICKRNLPNNYHIYQLCEIFDLDFDDVIKNLNLERRNHV